MKYLLKYTGAVTVAMAALLSISVPGTVWADEDLTKPFHNFWISLGLDDASFRDEEDETLGRVAVHFNILKPVFVTASFAGYRKEYWNLFGGPTRPTETFNEFAVMVGARAIARFGYVSASTGLSSIFGQQAIEYYNPKSYDSERWSSLGVPFDLQIVLTPIRYLGLGVGVHANFNSGHSFTSTNFSVHLGQIW